MQQWIFSKTTTKSTKPNYWKEKKENGTDRLLDTCYHSAVYNNSDGSYTVVIQEYECVVATHDGGSGGGLDEGAGGGSSTCDQQLLPTEDCPGAGNTDDCPLYCGGGGGTGDGGNSSSADNWEKKIDRSQLKPCMKDEFNMLTTIEEGVGEIIQDFGVDELNPGPLGNLNWRVKNKKLDANKNGETLVNYNSTTKTVTTNFDASKFSEATDLAITRTIMHEAVHAWVVSITFSTSLSQQEKRELFGNNWINVYENNGHSFIATDYVSRIADALQAFGTNKGYNLSRRFCEDMAWGGLNKSTEFLNKSEREKNRIKNTIRIEQTGKDQNGNNKSQKGNDGGC